MTDYKPGTVAMVRHVSSDEPPVLAFRDGDKGAVGWSLVDYRASAIWLSEDVVTDVRPLVVLDLADWNAAKLCADLRDCGVIGGDWLADQIEAQTRTKPDEPTGRYAVVEDSESVEWMRREPDGMWFEQVTSRPNSLSIPSFRVRHYADIDAVRILSDGVQP